MKHKSIKSRKEFIKEISLIAGGTFISAGLLSSCKCTPGSKIKLGLVTYLWAKDWDIPTIIKNCSAAELYGVELREQHAHGVGIELPADKRKEVKLIFEDSPVKLIGLGTNQQYDYLDPLQLKASIEKTKEWIKLSRDIGSSGVKVKPNEFHKEVPKEKTIEQIGKSLNELGRFAIDAGQQLRLEVHGTETSLLPNIKAMMDYVDNTGVKVCWNSNPTDLEEQGLVYNFNLVKNKLGETTHIRELNDKDYPFQELMNLFVGIDYKGWMLLECSSNPDDKVAALIEQRLLWEKMIANAQSKIKD
jgi:sugar phosphate isomerase/epimerase